MAMKDIWSKDTPLPKSVDGLLKAFPSESQEKLGELRKLILELAPQAEEYISYRMPAYKLNGQPLVSFAGYKKHVGFYPMSRNFLEDFRAELENFKTSRGTVQFPLDRPLPVTLIKKLVKAKLRVIKDNS